MKNYLFCQIDILGFSNLISNPPNGITMSGIALSYEKIFKKHLVECSSFQPNYMHFSDTAFIYQEKYENLIDFIVYLSKVMKNSFESIKIAQENIFSELYFEFPLRGAFSLGEFIITDTNIVGKPLISTYKWEKVQNWIGISIPPDDIETIKKSLDENFIYLQNKNLLINYDIATKEGIINTYALNYVTYDNHNELLKIVDKQLETYANKKEIYPKYYCTKKFIEYIIQNNLYVTD